jgi:hypothetical protein
MSLPPPLQLAGGTDRPTVKSDQANPCGQLALQPGLNCWERLGESVVQLGGDRSLQSLCISFVEGPEPCPPSLCCRDLYLTFVMFTGAAGADNKKQIIGQDQHLSFVMLTELQARATCSRAIPHCARQIQRNVVCPRCRPSLSRGRS